MSVVVPVRDHAGHLPRLLARLARQDYLGALDVIVVDNHPRPRLCHQHYLSYPMPVTVLHEARAGLARARNRGINAASGEWVLVTEADTLPCAGWVSAMVRALANSGAPLVGGQVLPDYPTAEGPLLGKGVLSLFMPTAWPSALTEVGGRWLLAGCNLGMPRSATLTFDPDLGAGGRFLMCEDLVTTMSTQAAGEFALLVPGAVVRRVLHDQDLTVRAVARRAWWHGVALARAAHSMPSANLPQYPLRDVAPWSRGFSKAWLLSALAGVARITGRRAHRRGLRHQAPRKAVHTCA
ncbi:glycosyltransferase family 2 protein [Streptomyces sp. HU2014]|uniref:glycosyltransferase family 2 protein n=1 Tax=Streptomyces sp. HU2014 TaxID=2939414 RepID=UPI00200F8E10|nr:glycosyltransferase family A protein [Streptomyces sp. HU2014]UQI45901.1 glycosyltransferase family 2 protein [Streptomyces sp. HU2014]